jgi:hypothetical protein
MPPRLLRSQFEVLEPLDADGGMDEAGAAGTRAGAAAAIDGCPEEATARSLAAVPMPC